MFNEAEWENIRTDALYYQDKKEKEFFKAWCEEAKLYEPIAYSFYKNTLTIYTNKPGWMIGCKGYLVDKYTEIFKKEFFRSTMEVKFIEVGKFTNY